VAYLPNISGAPSCCSRAKRTAWSPWATVISGFAQPLSEGRDVRHARDPIGLPSNHDHQGDQVRGFGFIHDGAFDTVFRFQSNVFFAQAPDNPRGVSATSEGDTIRRQLEDFMLAFSGQRLALDRDGDGAFDGDELSEGTDPADPASHP
jgi:hypothetical protein